MNATGPEPHPSDKRHRRILFGAFEVDLESGELRKFGSRLKLQQQPFQLLVALLEKPGELVSREELRRELWPESIFVDFDQSLNRAVNKLREVLADEPDNPRFVETIPRRGYRFIAPVHNVYSPKLGPALVEAPVSPPLLRQTTPLSELPAPGFVGSNDAAHSQTPADLRGEVGIDLEPSAVGADSEYLNFRSKSPCIDDPSNSSSRSPACALADKYPLEGEAVSRSRLHRGNVLFLILGFCSMLASLGYELYWSGAHHTQNEHSAFERMSINRISSEGKSAISAISPDSKYVVHAVSENGLQSLWTLQLASHSEIQIVPPAEVIFRGLSFSPDGSFVYFISASPKVFDYKTLYEVPLLGGVPRKIMNDVDSPVTFSPDGSRMAYVRVEPEQAKVALFTNNTEGSDERLISTRDISDMYFPLSRPAWSADGQGIILAARVHPGRSNLVEVPLSGEPERVLTTENWQSTSDPVWLADHSGLVFVASEPGSSLKQIWVQPFPTGEAHRITNDPNSYENLSLSADTRMVVATQRETTSSLWVAPEGKAELGHRITFNDKDEDGADGLAWTPDGEIVFTSHRGGNLDLWITRSDGSKLRQLTHGEGLNSSPSVSPDGRTIVFVSTRTGDQCIWKMGVDGGNPVQLTHRLEAFPTITPDGNDVIFGSWAREGIFQIPINGGEPVQLTSDFGFRPLVSPDGKLLAVMKIRAGEFAYYIDILPFGGGPSIKRFDIPLSYAISWAVDSNGIYYLDSHEGIGNIWLQPLAAVKPKQVTHFSSDEMYSFEWSSDGKQLASARGDSSSDIVLISNFH